MPFSLLQPPIPEVPITPPPNFTLPQAAVAALCQGRMIEAIQLVRLEQNIGLHEAGELIDRYLRSQPALKHRIDEAESDAREGLLRWLMFMLIGGGGLAYFLM